MDHDELNDETVTVADLRVLHAMVGIGLAILGAGIAMLVLR